MITLILSSAYFILPAYLANPMPVFAAKLKLPFGQPISEKLFGSHKTWRSFYVGYLGAVLILFLQRYFQNKGVLEDFRLLNYNEINIFFYGFLFGIGAINGDLVKSFFKRRVGIKEGDSWIPFDQLDFIIGAVIFLCPFYYLDWKRILVLLVFTPFLHLLSNIVGYCLRLKKVWW